MAVAVLALALPETPGVALTAAERGLAASALAAAGFGAGLVASAVGRRWAGTVLWPCAAVLTLAALPREGSLRVEVSEGWLWLWAATLGALLVLLARRPRAAEALCALAAVVGAVLTVPAPTRPPRAVGSDIVLVTLDTFRGDGLSWCGETGPPLPHLEALAHRGVAFCDAHSPASLTGPAHTSLLSGAHPLEHGVWSNGEPVPADLVWAPSLLAEAGWDTHAGVAAAVLDPALGFARGFRRYDAHGEHRLVRGHPLLGFVGWRSQQGQAVSRAGHEVLAHLPPRRGPRFVWVHLYDAHWPYAPAPGVAAAVGLSDLTPLPASLRRPALPGLPAPIIGPDELDRGRRLYDAERHGVDALVGRLVAGLPADARIVVVGDHGESFGEHGDAFGHGTSPLAPESRVPLIVVDGQHTGLDRELRGTEDVARTLLSLAGVEAPDGMGGTSLFEAGPGEQVSATFRRGFPRQRAGSPLDPLTGVALRGPGTTLAWTAARADPAALDRLADPLELGPGTPGPRAPFEPHLRAARGAPAPGELDAGVRRALEALGYVGGP